MLQVDNRYPVKVWITSVISTPIGILFVASLFDGPKSLGARVTIEAWFDMVLYNLIGSFPMFLICGLIFWWLTRVGFSELKVKIILSIICSVTVLTAFVIMGVGIRDFFSGKGWYITAVYVTMAVAAIFIFKIYRGSVGQADPNKTH